MLAAALVSTVAVFLILALDLAGYRWLERGIMAFVGVIGLCYGLEVLLVHPDWRLAAFHTLVPTLDPKDFHGSLYAAVGMLGATVMPHVVYLHSALVQPRRDRHGGLLVPVDDGRDPALGPEPASDPGAGPLVLLGVPPLGRDGDRVRHDSPSFPTGSRPARRPGPIPNQKMRPSGPRIGRLCRGAEASQGQTIHIRQSPRASGAPTDSGSLFGWGL